MILDPDHLIEIVTSSTSELHVSVSYRDEGNNPAIPKPQNTAITSAATTTVCAAPAAGTSRVIESVNIRNKGAATNTVTVQMDGAADYELYKATLAAEGLITWTRDSGWSTVAASSTLGVSNVVILQENVENSADNTAADVTGLSFAVTADLTYWFRFSIPYSSAATTTGSRWMINGPANPTALNMNSTYTLTATSQTHNNVTAYDIPAAANATSLTAGNMAFLEGTITPSADGTVIARFASEVNTSAITALAGAKLEWARVL